MVTRPIVTSHRPTTPYWMPLCLVPGSLYRRRGQRCGLVCRNCRIVRPKTAYYGMVCHISRALYGLHIWGRRFRCEPIWRFQKDAEELRGCTGNHRDVADIGTRPRFGKRAVYRPRVRWSPRRKGFPVSGQDALQPAALMRPPISRPAPSSLSSALA